MGPQRMFGMTPWVRRLMVACLFVFLLCAWIANNFKQSRTGRGFFALRENEKAAATLGVELTRYRLLAFTLSGGMAAGRVLYLGLDYTAALAGLAAAGTVTTPEVWAGVRVMEGAAIEELNRR